MLLECMKMKKELAGGMLIGPGKAIDTNKFYVVAQITLVDVMAQLAPLLSIKQGEIF